MTKWMVVVLAGGLAAFTMGCGSVSQPAVSSSAAQSSQAVPAPTQNGIPELAAEITSETPSAPSVPSASSASPAVEATTLVYRGTIDEFAVDEQGHTVLVLVPDYGAWYGAPMLYVTLPKSATVEGGELANGVHVEVESINTALRADQTLGMEALAVRVLLPAEFTTYNGMVQAVKPDEQNPGYGDLELVPLPEADGGLGFIFHYTPETVFTGRVAGDYKAGDLVHIYFDGKSTRSIPPQGTALEVRPFDESQPK